MSLRRKLVSTIIHNAVIPLLSLLIILDSVISVAESESLISLEQEKNHVNLILGKGAIAEVNREVFGYMEGRKDSIETGLLNEKEKAHMVDVRGIFGSIKLIHKILFFSILVYFILTRAAFLGRVLRISSILTFISLVLLSLISLVFDSAFTVFHKIFFRNDLWQMDGFDTMYLYYPEGFFFGLLVWIIARTLFICMLFYLSSRLLSRISPALS